MKNKENYKKIFEVDYKDEELVKYVCALSNKVPVYIPEETKIRFVSREELKELLKDLKKKGKLVELKKTLESLKKDYWKEFECELYRIAPLPMRFQYPYWVKLVEIALKDGSSVSAIIRQILLEEIENIILNIENSKDYNQQAINLLKKRLKDAREGIKERRSLDFFSLFVGFRPDEELKNSELEPSKTTTANEVMEAIRSFTKVALKKKMLASGISEELFELILEYMVFEPEFHADLRVENGDLVIWVEALPPFFPRGFSLEHLEEAEYDEFIVGFPIAALQRHSPEEIKKLVEVTGIPAFKGLSEEEIKILKNIVVQSEKTLGVSRALGVSDDDVMQQVLRKVYKNIEGFDPVLDSVFDVDSVIPDIIQDWVKFSGLELVGIKIPITVKDHAVYVKGTNVKVDDIVALSDYIAQEYKSRFNLNESPATINFENLSDESIDELLDGVENELAIKGAEILSLMLSEKIADSIRSSEVFTTTLPYGFTPILKLFTGKNPKEVVIDHLRGEL